MSKATFAFVATIILAASAWGVGPQVPPTPTTPQIPATPQTPATPRTPRTPRASYLGIDTCDVTPERASQLHLPKANGVEVAMVDQDAPAGKAGLKEHDVITAFNGQPVTDSSDLKSFIHDTIPGKTVTLGIVRDGKPMDVKATLGAHPMMNGFVMPPLPPIHIPSIDVPLVMMLSCHNGLTVEPLTQQLAEAFGSKSGRGVLIRSVEQNSAAANAGFHAGDIIVKVGNHSIDTVNDWNSATHQSGKVAVTVIRDKREQTLNLTISDKRRRNSAIDIGDINIETGDLSAELTQIGPQVEKALAEAHINEWQNAFNSPEFQKQIEQARRQAEAAAREWQKHSEEWQKEWQQQQKERQQPQQNQQQE